MATTSTRLARKVVRVLRDQAVEVALLHGLDRWEQGNVASDVDLVVDRPLSDFSSSFFRSLVDEGCFPIVVCAYDVACSSIFVVDRSCREGVQIDLNYDVRGAGREALLSGAVMRSICSDTGMPHLNDVDEWLYLVRKRLLKQQESQFLELLAEPPEAPGVLAQRASVIFAPRAARSVRTALETGQLPQHHSRSQIVALLPLGKWFAGRVRRPAGFWVDLRGTPEAVACARSQIVSRFARILPRSEGFGEGHPHPAPVLRGMLVRMKPALVVSTGLRRPFAPIDLTLPVDGVEQGVRDLVRAMAGRYGCCD